MTLFSFGVIDVFTNNNFKSYSFTLTGVDLGYINHVLQTLKVIF